MNFLLDLFHFIKYNTDIISYFEIVGGKMRDIKEIIYEEYINTPLKERESYKILLNFNKMEKVFEKDLSKDMQIVYENNMQLYSDYWVECQSELLDFCFEFLKNMFKVF